ncbi:MAG: hypothetical protein LBF12_06750, partial [Christensenellaceae bacterium]|nr:hypothetical protein [Christensenellaceae bacterium]
LYYKFIKTNGLIEVTDNTLNVKLHEKRDKALMLEMLKRCAPNGCYIHNKMLTFTGKCNL